MQHIIQLFFLVRFWSPVLPADLGTDSLSMPGHRGTKVRGYEIGALVARVSPAWMTLTLFDALGSFGGSLSGVGEDGRKRGKGGYSIP